MLMKKIDKKFMIDFHDYLQHTYMNTNSPKNPKPLSPRTCLAYQHQLTKILNDAVKSGALNVNPFYSLNGNEKVAEIPTARDYLTKEELELMASAETKNRLAKQAFMFACFTGLRYSDVASLMWGNIQHTCVSTHLCYKRNSRWWRSVHRLQVARSQGYSDNPNLCRCDYADKN